ncbi:protein amalgam-like isoform X3 [Limulus polyphemus]|uniref:Protein amalgam-like isoform X3 n=1 Tax=Limulus polyphemus TaxID=6850 RepID=A0ABM1S4L0_LIMPO|nr:protein amalgam-like isoform X3 [Limulus polyphemus]
MRVPRKLELSLICTRTLLIFFSLLPFLTTAQEETFGNISDDDMFQKARTKRLASSSHSTGYWSFVQPISPFFDKSPPTNITTQQGQTVYLNCVVNNLGDKTVSWIRRRDLHLLTVGTETYINEDRFSSAHIEGGQDWPLMIKYPQTTDAGIYECQVSSDPKITFLVQLNIVVPKAEILGPHPMYVKIGSSINLTCVISESPEPPMFVFWYHNKRMVNYDKEGGEISLQKASDDSAISTLYIKNAQPTDSGNYTCGPSNAEATSISVFFLHGEKPAAIQRDTSASLSSSSSHHDRCVTFVAIVSWALLR